MKNFTLLTFLILLLSACVKEDIGPLISDSADGVTRLYVKVSFYDDSASHGCGDEELVPLYNAKAVLYENSNEVTDGKIAIMQSQTNLAGLAKFEYLESSEYDLEVNSPHGTIEQKVHIEAGKTTRISLRY